MPEPSFFEGKAHKKNYYAAQKKEKSEFCLLRKEEKFFIFMILFISRVPRFMSLLL